MKYINVLAGIKLWTILILFVLFLFCILSCVLCVIVQTIKNKRKIKLLKSYGCERYLSGVPSVGNGAYYSWKTPDYKINIGERNVASMKYRDLKELLKTKAQDEE